MRINELVLKGGQAKNVRQASLVIRTVIKREGEPEEEEETKQRETRTEQQTDGRVSKGRVVVTKGGKIQRRGW